VGNGFPGLAIVSVIALLVALGLAALLVSQPWKADLVTPHLSVAPRLGIGLGDAAVVSPGRRLAVAPAQPAAAAPRFVAAAATAEGDSQPRVGLAAARVVTAPDSVRAPAGPPGQPAPEAPAPAPPMPVTAPPPASASVPVSLPPPTPVLAGSGGEAPGPVAAGGGTVEGGAAGVIEVCEGDDYTLAIPPSEETEGIEAPPVDLARHDLTVYFANADEGEGFYLVFLDGLPVEIGDEPVAAESARRCARIDLGLLLGESIEAGAEIRIEAVTLDEEMEPAVP
jgi:hypothetical protein